MIHFILFVLCTIILILSLLLTIIFCCNIYSCHERHRDRLTKQNWYTSRKRGIFSVHYFEQSHRVQIQPPLDGQQNLARPQPMVPRQLPNQSNLAKICHPKAQKPTSLYSQDLWNWLLKGFIVIFKQITSSQKNSMLNFLSSNWHHQQIVFKKIFLGFFLLLIGFNCQHFFREGLQNFPCNAGTCDLLFYRLPSCHPVLCPLLPLQVQFVKWTNLSFFGTTCLHFQDYLLLSIDILSV